MKLSSWVIEWALHRDTTNEPTIKILRQLEELFDSVVPMRALVFDTTPSHVNTFSSFLVEKECTQLFLKIGAPSSILTEVKNAIAARKAINEIEGLEVLLAKTISFGDDEAGFTTKAIAGVTLDSFRSSKAKAVKQKLQQLVVKKLLTCGVVWPGFADRNIIVREHPHIGHTDASFELILVDWERGIHHPAWVGTLDGIQRSIELIEEASVSLGTTIPYWHADVPPYHTVHNECCYGSELRIHIEKKTAPRVYALTKLFSSPSAVTITEFARYSKILATNNDNDTGTISTLYAADIIESAGFLNLRVLLDLALWHVTKFQHSQIPARRNAILTISAQCSHLMAQEFLQRDIANATKNLFGFLEDFFGATLGATEYEFDIHNAIQAAKSYIFSTSVLPSELVEPEVFPLALIRG